ncbi:MAG: YceI family protein [Planctomycetes bacterium]|nr:YceI family protein [Planctomycetota bacterium]MBI3402252.1 YceI family protein [Acidobacteriota bacterium]
MAVASCAPVGVAVDTQAIDRDRSTLTIDVDKGGVFSALADRHVIRAPIAAGLVTLEGTPAAELTVNAAELVAVDPALSAAKRAEVTARMIGPDVLDAARYPEIRFSSTAITPDGADRWRLTGMLLLHGVSRAVAGTVSLRDAHYRGQLALKQSAFGIRPISIAGGTVKVKDDVRVMFDIVVSNR